MSDLQDEPAEQPQPANPTMTRDELVAAAESIGMRFPAEQPQPVAEVVPSDEVDINGDPVTLHTLDWYAQDIDALPVGTKLYAAPPTREPARLTDGQMHAYAAAVEAATIERCAALLDAEHARDKHMHNYAAYYARMLREMKP